MRQKINLKKSNERKGISPTSDRRIETEHILTELNGGLIRYSDLEFESKKVAPENLKKASNSGIALLKKKYTKDNFYLDLDESKEVEASRLAEELHEKGYVARQNGDLEKAVQYYTQALDLCPEFHTVDTVD